MSSRNTSVEKKIEKLMMLFEKQNERIDKISEILKKIRSEQFSLNRAETEQITERNEQTLTTKQTLNRVTGRYREVLSLLINNGFHTYGEIARKLNISESRARAYIAELKNEFNIPIRQVKDPEGFKVGVDISFVEQILAFK